VDAVSRPLFDTESDTTDVSSTASHTWLHVQPGDAASDHTAQRRHRQHSRPPDIHPEKPTDKPVHLGLLIPEIRPVQKVREKQRAAMFAVRAPRKPSYRKTLAAKSRFRCSGKKASSTTCKTTDLHGGSVGFRYRTIEGATASYVVQQAR
jgi:hypothetical protein